MDRLQKQREFNKGYRAYLNRKDIEKYSGKYFMMGMTAAEDDDKHEIYYGSGQTICGKKLILGPGERIKGLRAQ